MAVSVSCCNAVSICGSMVCCENLEVERIRTGLERGGRTECKRGGVDLHSLLKSMERRRGREKLF